MSRDLIERLREEARQTSEASRMLAQAKSRRQADNPTGEDIYTWLKPEETTAWQAADVIGRLVGALEPFAAMGRVMETRARVTFGKIPKDSEIVCESSGEAGMGILTMGHFRDAAALLPNAPGWGGMYKPLSRQALASIPSTTIDSQQETAV